MQKDERDLLEVLKFELKFLEDGGYGRSPRSPWRPQLIFEDSPTCANFNSAGATVPCADCVLMQLVPPEFRSAQIPCRHIPLDSSGETLDSLYRYGDQVEIEEVVGGWLRSTIKRLEEERAAAEQNQTKQLTNRSVGTTKGTPLYQKLHPKCANPACPTAFHWTAGGKFFRFRPDGATATPKESAVGIHGVRHYWLCERCSHMFDLVYDEQCGVILKVFWTGLPATESSKKLSAA